MPALHTHREYEAELTTLRDRLLLMAGRVEEMIVGAMRSFEERDMALALQTIECDARVNLDELEIDELCQRILARRQPMASDLRFLTLALKMVVDLERIADLAVNICERTLELAREPRTKRYEDIPRMATLVESMVRDAIDAFVATDADEAWDVITRDDEVDDLNTHVFRTILADIERGSIPAEAGLHELSVAKFLERMADHSTNVAELVVFMVKGKDIRHIGKLDPR